MALTGSPISLVAQLNGAAAGQLPDMLRTLGFGSMVRQAMPCTLRHANPFKAGTNPYTHTATLISIQLPDDAKAARIQRAYARSQDASESTGAAGELTVKGDPEAGTPYTTPTTGTLGVSPSGDLVFLATDAYNDVDIVYMPEKQDVVEVTLPVVAATGVCTLPAAMVTLGVVSLMEAEALAGSVVGKAEVLVPSDSNPGATHQANLKLAKGIVLWKATDAVTSCRLKLGVVSSIDANALLEAASSLL